MPIVHVPDADDDRLEEYTRLTDVRLRTRYEPERGLYMAESSTVIRRAVAAGHRPRSFLMAPRWLEDMAEVTAAFPDAPVYVADEPVLERITGFHLHRGALAAMHRPQLPAAGELLDGARRVVVLEDVVDHTNVGAMFRSAAGLGVDAVLVTPRCADPLYRRSARVSMGTVFQVPWTRIEPWPDQGIEVLKQNGHTIAALALSDDAIGLDALEQSPPDRLALIVGTEGAGLRPRTMDLADLRVKIPMAGGVDSLNVAAALAVALWGTRIDRGVIHAVPRGW